MPMTVMNNNAAAMALGELNKNTSKLAKDLQKISSGKRINSAANGASEYSVGKKMEVMIRSLGQDIINTQTGRDLIKVAEGGIQEIVDIIRNMKEMALNSANDHNTDLDRATLQKEFNQRIHEISNIAGTTNYNGRLLLNGDYAEGSWGEKEEIVTEISEVLVEEPIVSSTNPLVDEPTGAVTIINAGDYTISINGIYMLAPDYQGTITVNAGNVELRSNIGVTNEATYINCPNSNTNLWLNDLKIDNWDYRDIVDKSIIKFKGTGNTLNLIGNNFLRGQGKTTAMVNIGSELTIYKGNLDEKIPYLNINNTKPIDNAFPEYIANNTYGAFLGADAYENSNGILTISGGQIRVGGGYSSYYIKDFYDGNYIGHWGAAIGSGAYGTFGSIIVNGEGNIGGFSHGLKGAAVGTGYQGTLTGDITITGNGLLSASVSVLPRTIKNLWSSDAFNRVPASSAAIGCGVGGKILGNINIVGGRVHAATDFGGAGIGTAGDDEFTSYVGGINIGNAKVFSLSMSGEAIGRGGSPNDPECSHGYIDENGKKGTIFSDVSTLTGSVGNITLSDLKYSNEWDYNGEIKYHKAEREKSSDGDDNLDVIISGYDIYKKYETYQPGNPLIIHTGPKANLNLQVFINSMHPIAMGMVGISVNSRENAVKSLEKLDNALEYALKEQTKMGAYQMRLSETEETLIAEHENTTSAESVLTDADMAKEMSEFTKDNVLSQTAQAMLSQEQKNAGAVLQMLE